MEKFEQFKNELLARAKAADACAEQYSRALHAETMDSLLAVVRDKFRWAVRNNVLTGEFIDEWKDEFATGNIWHNCNVENGYLLATEGRFVARGNSSVEARGNSSVEAYDNSSVVAYDNSYTTSYNVLECELNERAIHRIRKTNTIRYADKNMKFELVEDNGQHE